VLPFGRKIALGLLETINLEVVLFRAYAPFPALLPFFKRIPEVVFCECSLPSAILPRLTQLRQNGGLLVLSAIREKEESMVGGL
jgi:hypothetical protein